MTTDFRTLVERADDAGRAAADRIDPMPWCGFAWVRFAGNTAFGRWAKREGIARKAYGGGLEIWIFQYNQSIDLKAAYARAFAEALQEAGIDAYSGSRYD